MLNFNKYSLSELEEILAENTEATSPNLDQAELKDVLADCLEIIRLFRGWACWRPMESAPDNTPVLVTNKNGCIYVMERFDGSWWKHVGANSDEFVGWFPLPTAAKDNLAC